MSLSDDEIEGFRRQLLEMRTDLSDHAEKAGGNRATVTLDQQSVGRLSRMDALQQQAMAQATHARRRQMETRIAAALARIAAGEFGFCDSCGEDIPPKRLALDPTITRCVSCAAG